MLLIIAHHHDREAEWLFKSWKENYAVPVRFLLPEALGIDYDITLRLNNKAQHRACISFYQTGEKIDCMQLSFVVNRLSYIDPFLWDKSVPGEKMYATSEINAFFPAFIHALRCPLSNQIYNGALYGEIDFDAKWFRYLREEGFAIYTSETGGSHLSPEIMMAVPGCQIFRILYSRGRILLPPDQPVLKASSRIAASIIQHGSPETLEFVFRKDENGEPALLYVSKTPSMSCYGKDYMEVIFKQIKKHNDNSDRHTERNAIEIAGRSL